jgi:hypothetical protein
MTALIDKRTKLFGLLVSDSSNPTEVFLKLAILSVRQNVLKEESVPIVIRTLEEHLRVSREQAAEILQLTVTPPGKGVLGYLGDFSPHSFAVYLRRVKRGVYARDSNGEWDDKAAGSVVGPHPWAKGTAALLSRLAIEYEISGHQARQWVRDGKLEGVKCHRREETTAGGRPVFGEIEVRATQRATWTSLCMHYVDMQVRKARTRKGSASEKKRLYRRATKQEGTLNSVRRYILQREETLGLPDLPPWVKSEKVEDERDPIHETVPTKWFRAEFR